MKALVTSFDYIGVLVSGRKTAALLISLLSKPIRTIKVLKYRYIFSRRVAITITLPLVIYNLFRRSSFSFIRVVIILSLLESLSLLLPSSSFSSLGTASILGL